MLLFQDEDFLADVDELEALQIDLMGDVDDNFDGESEIQIEKKEEKSKLNLQSHFLKFSLFFLNIRYFGLFTHSK